MAFNGLAYSLFPYLVVDQIDIWQAASAPESLAVILIGAAVVLPTILGYTVYAYRVFWGKATTCITTDPPTPHPLTRGPGRQGGAPAACPLASPAPPRNPPTRPC